MYAIDDMGREEGDERGPEPGKGAVVHQLSGEDDFDGLPGDVLPPRKTRTTKTTREDQPAPPKKDAE